MSDFHHGLQLLEINEDTRVVTAVVGNGGYARFFSQPVLLGPNGIDELKDIGQLSEFEQTSLNSMLNEYLNTSSEFSLRMLLANLLELNGQADRNEVLRDRYNGEFAPSRWELTTQKWLDIVNQRLVEYMDEKGYSTELSYF